MPQQPSQHKQVLQAASTTAFIMMFDSENESDSDLEDFLSFCKHQYQKRYLTARGTTTWFHPRYDLSAVQSLSDSCFQQLFCMSWPCFLNLLHLIEPDPIFYNQSQNPQQDVLIQLAVATCRLRSNGKGAAFFRLKNLFQVGYGTINLYTTQMNWIIVIEMQVILVGHDSICVVFPKILNEMSQFNWLLPYAAWDLTVTKQLFSDSRISSKLDT